MKNYYLFLDESGDHGLANINQFFPVFLLCGVLFESENYIKCRDEINEVKEKFWNTKEIIFHSSDIRKFRKGFENLFNENIRKEFIEDINTIISGNEYLIFADGLQKEEFIKRYGKLSNVYELCLSFILERTYLYLNSIQGEKKLYVIIEKRGKKEDFKLRDYINKVIDRGTNYIKPQQFQSLKINVQFRAKSDNINGLQMADLIAYPIARYVLNKKQPNPPFDVLKPKIYRYLGKITGLKMFP